MFKDRKAQAEQSVQDRRGKEEETKKKLLKAQDRDSNHILTVENLPAQVTEEMLEDLFSQYPGFKWARLNKKGKAIWSAGIGVGGV